MLVSSSSVFQSSLIPGGGITNSSTPGSPSVGVMIKFVLTMLGKTDIVKSLLKAFPVLLNSKGPHGFTLLHHAKKGGKDAEKLLNHLQKLGLTETFIPLK